MFNLKSNHAVLEALRRTIPETKPKHPKLLQPPRSLQHNWLLPCLLHADDHLWHRGDCWLQELTARQIVALIPKIEWQKSEFGFKMLDRSLSAIIKNGDWRGWNSWAAFDCFVDWLLLGFGHKGQPDLSEEKSEYERANERLYQVFNLETLLAWPYDYFGDILAENQHGRHLGFFPTPFELCQLMARVNFGEEDARTKTVFDPGLGTGRV